MNRRTFIRITAGTAALPILTACTVLDARDDRRHAIEIVGLGSFAPGGLTIRVGDTVVWRNQDTRPHKISTDPAEFTAPAVVLGPEGSPPFTSPELLPNDRFTRTFQTAGQYVYGCPLYPNHQLIGTITVEP